MKFTLKSLVVMSAMVMAGTVQAAAATGTLTRVSSFNAQGWNVSNLDATSGKLVFSSDFIKAANATGASFSAVAPGSFSTVLSSFGRYTSASFSAPVASARVEIEPNTLTLRGSTLKGGFVWQTVSDDLTSTGGYLVISNLGVDLVTRTIYADIDGDNGVGRLDQVALWQARLIEGATTFAAQEGPALSSLRLSGLSISSYTAFNILVQSLGALDAGKSALQRITDYGVLTMDVGTNLHHVGMPITASVPEPETAAYALVGLGLIGVAASRRARRC